VAVSSGEASCTVVWPCAHGALIELAGELDVATLPLLRRACAPLIARGDLVVVIDMSRVTFIDASVVGTLASLERAVTGRGGQVRVRAGTSPAVTRMLELTGWLPDAGVTSGDVVVWSVAAWWAGQ
jgi:anti-sigma B factor antagonist